MAKCMSLHEIMCKIEELRLEKNLKKLAIFILFFLLILISCSSKPQYIFYKTHLREQLKKRAIRHCFGDFKIINRENFGPYTRAQLECKG